MTGDEAAGDSTISPQSSSSSTLGGCTLVSNGASLVVGFDAEGGSTDTVTGAGSTDVAFHGSPHGFSSGVMIAGDAIGDSTIPPQVFSSGRGASVFGG